MGGQVDKAILEVVSHLKPRAPKLMRHQVSYVFAVLGSDNKSGWSRSREPCIYRLYTRTYTIKTEDERGRRWEGWRDGEGVGKGGEGNGMGRRWDGTRDSGGSEKKEGEEEG